MNNKIFVKLLSIYFVCVIFFTSCEKYPIDALLGRSAPIGNWPDIWYVYDDEFNTKGSIEPYVFKDNPDGSPNLYIDSWDNIKLDFNCRNTPQSGTRCIKFGWLGNAKDTRSPRKTFFSFGMQSRQELGGTIDLSNSGYKFLKFYIRGTLYENCSFEISVPYDANPNTSKEFPAEEEITSVWREVSIPIEDYLGNLDKLEYVLAFSLKVGYTSNITNGGEVYIDNIRFTKD